MIIQRTLSMLLVAITLAACGDGRSQETANDDRAPIAVRTAPVTTGAVAPPIGAVGTVAPKDEISLSFKVGGVIERISVDAGDAVQRGQMLAVLDPREIEAAFTKARSVAAKAERDLARARRLYVDSVVTLAQFQDAQTASELANADLAAAAFNRRYAMIVAPARGTVLRRAAEPGETISPGSEVLVLGSRTRGTILEVRLADRDALRVRTGDPAVARFDALPGVEFRGDVSQIGAAADPATGTYAVEIALRDAGHLTAGLVGEVEIQPGSGPLASLVPIEAILEADGKEAIVYALSDDGTTAVRRRVTVAFIDGDRVAIARGLEGVEAVIIEGAAYVDEGALVRVSP